MSSLLSALQCTHKIIIATPHISREWKIIIIYSFLLHRNCTYERTHTQPSTLLAESVCLREKEREQNNSQNLFIKFDSIMMEIKWIKCWTLDCDGFGNIRKRRRANQRWHVRAERCDERNRIFLFPINQRRQQRDNKFLFVSWRLLPETIPCR